MLQIGGSARGVEFGFVRGVVDGKLPVMGSDWSWTLALPAGALNSATVERLLAVVDAFGLSPHRPDGGITLSVKIK